MTHLPFAKSRSCLARRLILAVTVFIAPAITHAGTEQPAAPGREALVAETQAITLAYSGLGWFSGTVLLAQGGQPFYQASFGMSDLASGTPNHNDTKYNLGSIIKHYTAVLVLQQVEDGTLDLEDRLDSFRLGFPEEVARKVTVRHLLEHRSGFADIFTAEYRDDPLAFDSIEKRLELLKDAPLLFEPGSDQRYSNYGFVVLGAILQKVSGQSFAELLQRNIFDRLGLDDSVYPYRADMENQSLRYSFNYDAGQKLVGVTEHHGPDGGIESTAEDTLAFYHALFHGDERLLRDGEVIREYFAVDGTNWTAFGGGAGVSAAVELDLDDGYEIVVLANSDHLVAEEISGRVYAFINSGTYEPVMLPPHAYAWSVYEELGAEAFKTAFEDRYTSAGYTQFIGRTLNDLGMALVRDGRWDEAFDIFGALVERFPEAPQAYDSLAYAYLKKGDPDAAARAFRKALVLQPAFASDYSPDNYGVKGAE